MVVQPLCIPLVICPVHRTYVIVVWWNDGLLCGKYKWVSQFQTPCCSHSVDRWALSGAGAFIFHPWHCTFIINSPDNSMCVAHWQVSNGMGSEQTLLQDSSLPSLTPAHTLLEWLFQKQHGSSLTLWEPGYDIFVLWFQPKTSNFSCLTNALAPPPIALESCLMTQTDRPA